MPDADNPDSSDQPGTPPAGTLPSSADDRDVLAFLRLHQLNGPPVYVDYLEGPYGENWCHVSAKHKAITDGGRRVHGWALWAYGNVVVGDHHSVWETPDKKLVDVTPPKFGERRVLFVRDDTATIDYDGDHFLLLTNRSSDPHAAWMMDGRPSEYSHYPSDLSRPVLVDYCASFGIPPSAIVTDDEHG